ncbi:hypothetical protein [Bradyrhizobium sp.]|uniref:hypothetical protein n=1 Tax=Bradyrhizobium sp. TaxID=376 RepID=UPI001DEFB58F|nr:hypothetical protein [Bradyrhizobium sp.]MBI5322233.1 hypothetical protein [Bradyrhizobium sp.]
MRRVFALCAASSLALSAVAMTGPAQAAPFHIIKWSGSNFCQIWDNGVPTKPVPSNYKAVSKPVPTFDAALAVKAGLMKKGVCKL